MKIRLLSGIKLPSRKGSADVILRKVGAIAAIEDVLENPSAEWRPNFEPKRDAASLATFGITEADANPPEPHPDDIKDEGPLARWYFGDEALAAYNRALRSWHDWQDVIGEYEDDMQKRGPVSYWAGRGVDVSNGHGFELACFRLFSRQLFAAHKQLLPGAKITTDGSGRRLPPTTKEWGAALATEAARFRARGEG